MLKIGSVVDDRYEILKEIGRGGMSVVYLAMDNRLNKSLVVKDIRKRANSNNELLLNSLVVEANMLKKLDHGSLPKIYDIIESTGDIYVVMDYIEGESLGEKLKREQAIAPDLVIDWAKQLSIVLGYLHSRQPNPIIYRDMKPDNVMLTPEGKIKLIDFGIAREFKTESSTDTTNLGSKPYAAPEQKSGKQTDARSDIYSLGMTLYHLVTGKTINEPPFEVKPIRYWDPSFPEGLEHIINKCTMTEPSERYQTCEELLYDLENIDKLTSGYKRQLYKKLAIFAIPVVLFFSSVTTSYVGYSAIQEEIFRDYRNLIDESTRYVLDGEDMLAVETLEYAIEEVDRRSADAYINMLDIYISRGETDVGLSRIESYINAGFGRVDRNDDVLFKVGMTYFDIMRDYRLATRYFERVDESAIPDAQYYITLATTLGQMNIDYNEFADDLLAFWEYTDSLPNDVRKIENYIALANVYSSYKMQLPQANSNTIELIMSAKDLVQRTGDEQMEYMYEVEFEEKLAQAFHSRGVEGTDLEQTRSDFERAIDHYNMLLELDVSYREEAMMRIGVIYNAMGEEWRAVEQYQLTIEEFPKSLATYRRYIELLLDIEQSKPAEERNYTRALEVFEEASLLDGADEDDAFQRIVRRLNTLNLL
ncbi:MULTISPECIES: serine/threonine-protein kinase [Bacillaceae]|uniref:non-specific serine/threonine protein kinase n=1 Tax=Evansella alkalicola TaxID=745819 RepID=A0ABS6K0L5_9BACI|nr:serine/threonine-protein kinase [Litchfieldia alkalitelluris]MBU9724263.1 protein kinase [Bacillus alkalicola]